jgi:hypothetical protein
VRGLLGTRAGRSFARPPRRSACGCRALAQNRAVTGVRGRFAGYAGTPWIHALASMAVSLCAQWVALPGPLLDECDHGRTPDACRSLTACLKRPGRWTGLDSPSPASHSRSGRPAFSFHAALLWGALLPNACCHFGHGRPDGACGVVGVCRVAHAHVCGASAISWVEVLDWPCPCQPAPAPTGVCANRRLYTPSGLFFLYSDSTGSGSLRPTVRMGTQPC